MEFREFETRSDLFAFAGSLLVDYIQADIQSQHGIMLTGGNTAKQLYLELAQRNITADPHLHLLLSDDRHVPLQSPLSNYGFIRDLVASLSIDDSHSIRPRPELPLDDCAARYHDDLATFLDHGSIRLAILGLGADGHLASLFNAEDVSSGRGRYAIAIRRREGPDRVSVTSELLQQTERTVFVAMGSEKADAVNRLIKRPDTIPAGMVLGNAAHVSLCYCKH